jgi:hypothetical protein
VGTHLISRREVIAHQIIFLMFWLLPHHHVTSINPFRAG